MHKPTESIIIYAVIIAFIFAGCSHYQNPVAPTGISNQTNTHKLSIPIGAVIDSAIFYIYAGNVSGEEVTLHAITANWSESTVTWNNFDSSFSAASEGSFTPPSTGWYFVNVTALVNSWLDSSLVNNGVLLKQNSGQLQYFLSRESVMGPYLKISWTLNGMSGVDSSTAVADALINSGQGDQNYGDSTDLITGWQDTTEMQSLVKFEIEQIPVSVGCTHSFGYWKTHSVYGPAPYDTIWALLGEDSTFFLSEKSIYTVLWTPPKHGNAYYILAHQYIATDLNFLGGADPTVVQESFNDATTLFMTYTPAQIGDLSGGDSLRHHFISLSEIFEQYNSGIIGPGSCDRTSAHSAIRVK